EVGVARGSTGGPGNEVAEGDRHLDDLGQLTARHGAQVARLLLTGRAAAIAVQRVAVVALFVDVARQDDAVATGRGAAGGRGDAGAIRLELAERRAAVAGIVVAIVAALAELDDAVVVTGRRDQHAIEATGRAVPFAGVGRVDGAVGPTSARRIGERALALLRARQNAVAASFGHAGIARDRTHPAGIELAAVVAAVSALRLAFRRADRGDDRHQGVRDAVAVARAVGGQRRRARRGHLEGIHRRAHAVPVAIGLLDLAGIRGEALAGHRVAGADELDHPLPVGRGGDVGRDGVRATVGIDGRRVDGRRLVDVAELQHVVHGALV